MMRKKEKLYFSIFYVLLLLLGLALGTTIVTSIISLTINHRDAYLPLVNLIAIISFIIILALLVFSYLKYIGLFKRQKRKDNIHEKK